MYALPRNRSWDLLEDLLDELEGVEPDSPLAKEITSVIIPDQWLQLFVTAFEILQFTELVPGEQLLFFIVHYQVLDWDALDHPLSVQANIEAS